jgi:hypothetical protein
MERILFSEEQRHDQWWLWLTLIVSMLAAIVPFLYGIYSQEVLDKPFGDEPVSTTGLIISCFCTTAIMGTVLFLFARSRLKTKINYEGIWYCYPPLSAKWKKVSPEEIERYEIKTFKAIREFGGYGIKKRRKFGTAIIVSGNTGLQLYLKNGTKLLIGTQKRQALVHAVEKMMERINL